MPCFKAREPEDVITSSGDGIELANYSSTDELFSGTSVKRSNNS